MRTRKVGSTGRFGVRYGLKIRKDVLKIDLARKAKHKCPSCMKTTIKRESAGIWFCKCCGLKFAGRAYQPS